jgi:hypothetical protein
MEAKDRDAVVMPAMGNRSEKMRMTTGRVKKRTRRSLGADDDDRLEDDGGSLCGDGEEEEWDVDIQIESDGFMSDLESG